MKYTDICEAKTEKQMQRLFAQHLKDCAEKFGGTPESHRQMQMHNVGYFSGYYSSETARNILNWLGAVHPIFGTSHAAGAVTPEAALKAGSNAASLQPPKEKT